jgi:hypothetical protein
MRAALRSSHFKNTGMRYLILLPLLIALTATSLIQEHGKWVIDYNSQLLIHGQTNVNSFTCLISCYNSTDTLNYQINQQSKELAFDKNIMVVPIYNFNCGNNLITKDFRTTVKAEHYPYLTISFVSLEQNSESSINNGTLDIALAGVTKRVAVKFTQRKNGDFLQLSGNHSVCFTDFELQAPERMLGLVKVQKDLRVEFKLLIRPISD